MPCLGGFELEAREGGEVSHGSSQEEWGLGGTFWKGEDEAEAEGFGGWPKFKSGKMIHHIFIGIKRLFLMKTPSDIYSCSVFR